jgi:hypothetical protein
MPPKKKKALKGRGLYQKTVNKLFGAKLGKDEYHPPVWTKKGVQFPSFLGPGTNIYDNIRKGKKPINEVDRISMAHDLRYSRATNSAQVRDADLRMLKKIKEVRKNKGDYKINLLIGEIPIRAKMMAEDLGITRKGLFADMKGVPEEHKKLNESELAKLELKGYGRKGKSKSKITPKSKPSKWRTHVNSIKQLNPSMSYKSVLKLASKSYSV